MRRIILAIAVIVTVLGLLFTLSPYILRWSGLDEPVKQHLVKKVLQDSDYKLDADKLYFGLNNLDLEDVRFISSEGDFRIDIERIRFTFSFWNLWTDIKHPQKALRNIYFVHPSIIFQKNKGVKALKSKNDTLIDLDQQLLEKINKLPSIGRIQIRDGQIFWQLREEEKFKIAQDISGWIDTKRIDNIILNTTGKLFSEDEPNIQISARIDLTGRKLSSSVMLKKYSFNSPSIEGVFSDFPITSGLIDGIISLENHSFRYDSTRINGNLVVKNVGFSTEHAMISNFGFDLRIQDNKLMIEQAKGLFAEEYPFEIGAYIENVLDPEPDITITATDFPLEYFNRYVNQIPFNGSTANLNMHVTFKKGQAEIDGNLYAKDISIFSDPFNDCQLYFNWKNSMFSIDHLTANWHGLSILGNARYYPDAQHVNVELNGFQNLGQHVVFDRISNKIQKINIFFDYYGADKTIAGSWYYSLAHSQDTVFTISGDIAGDENTFRIVSTSTNIKDVFAEINIDNYLTSPILENARIVNFPFAMFSSAPLINDVFKKIQTEVSLSGSLKNLYANIEISPIHSSRRLFSLNTRFLNLLNPSKQVNGSIDLKNMTGGFEFVFDNQFLGGDFSLGEGIDGEFYIDITKAEQLYGKINFDEFKVIQAFADSIADNDFRSLGYLNGGITISGTVREPKIEGALTADKFVFNDIGYYQAKLHFNADRSKFQSDTLEISLNNSPVLSGSLDWTLLNNLIDANLYGNNLNITDILRTFNYDPDILNGTGNFEIRIGGNLKHPQFDADIEVNDGVFRRIPFDQMEIKLTDIVRPDGSIFNIADHFISLENFYISQQGRYHLHSIGKLPLNTQSEMDIVVSFDGDLFGLIPYWHSFFKDGVSLVDLTMNIRGTRDNIHLERAEIKIERGELWLGKVAEHVEEISGEVILKPGTNQIDFVDFQGSVQDKTLFIRTVRDVTTEEGRKLEHWFFDDLNLDFGILAMETSERGVRLNIPGLMLEEESGKMELRGRGKDEKFYFAGPVRHPLAYGNIFVYDSRVTFPFITDDRPGEKESMVVEFLRNMEWDVNLYPGEDILYFRAIPAYIDEVQAEIYVDESSEGLHFSGILNLGTFNTVGRLESTRGRLEYLDQNFRVDHFNLEFTEGELFPDVSGKAWTSIRDSVGAVPRTIYLQLYVTDPETGQELQRGNWENFKFKLVSADPQIGETQEQVLAYMGYSVDNIREKATSVGGAMTEKLLIRPLLRPIERALERNLGMDLVRFNSSIAKNLFYGSIGSQENYVNPKSPLNPFTTTAPYLFLMQSSEITLGKYVTQDIYLTYTGQLVSVYDQVESGFDFNHSIGLEYRFLRNILLEFEYDRELMGYYRVLDERQYMEDFKIRLRHSFSF